MNKVPSNSDSTILVALGAHEFPFCDLTSSTAFLNAHLLICSYFINEFGYNLPEENFINFFDSTLEPNSLITQVKINIIKTIERLKKINIIATDIVFYYVGHGSFDEDRRYYLALNCTNQDQQSISCLHVSEIIRAANSSAPDLRKYFIIDACYAGEAAYTQTSISNIVSKEIDKVPREGMAFLCSSSRDRTSEFLEDHSNTVFSESLSSVLWNSHINLPRRLTLENINDLVVSYMTHRPKFIRSEIHAPYAPEGDIAKHVSLFPNGPKSHIIDKAKAEAEEREKQILHKIQLEIEYRKNKEIEHGRDILKKQDKIADKLNTEVKQASITQKETIDEAIKKYKSPKYSNDEEKEFRELAEVETDIICNYELLRKWCLWKSEYFKYESKLCLINSYNLYKEERENKQIWFNLYSHMQVAQKNSSYDMYRSYADEMLKVRNAEKEAKRKADIQSNEAKKYEFYAKYFYDIADIKEKIKFLVEKSNNKKTSFSNTAIDEAIRSFRKKNSIFSIFRK